MQKKALAAPSQRWPTVGDIVLSPQWIFGLIIAAALPVPLVAVAYNLAPISLISPLSGVTIFLNFVLAPWLLGEALHLRIDVPAGILIIGGCVATTLTGNHGTDMEEVDAERLGELVLAPLNIAQVCVLALSIAGGVLYMYSFREGIQVRASERPTNPPMMEVMMPALMYGLFGSVSNIALAAGTHTVSHLLTCAVVLAIAGAAGVLQLNFFNRGLRLYMQIIFFPVGNAMLLVFITVVGMIFYEEYEAFDGAPERAVVFCLGILLVVLGIYLFRFRRTDAPNSGSEGAEAPATEPEADIHELKPVDIDLPSLSNEEASSAEVKGDAPDSRHCPAPALCGVTEESATCWSL